ncbi:MPT63 family protein [Mycobacterium sp. E740]|uniref:MPT63 family protein n=1 Tax=Mycobacterium sp. E740 TaxID=1834149 RepID=UPI0007FE092C|nr:MPT63 family protein [Mycobacterium sp. E740]OBI72379.1 phosphopeptide-binding protein [Mycobacterium sp. E740]
MKMTKITSVFAATATAGFIAAPIAAAEVEAAQSEAAAQTQTLGSQGKLVDGAVVQGWTVTGLKPSSDAIPYHAAGTLWEATATDQAVQGSATPIVSNFNARAADGQTYRALFGVATPQGVNPSTIAQGQQTSGKVYFDVTGASPDSVVYNAGGRDLLVWTQPPASSSSSSSPSTAYGAQNSPATAAPAQAPGTAAPEGAQAAPAANGAEVPEGTEGAPLPEGSQGTPIAPQGTPHGTPTPASSGAQGVPQPATSHGTSAPTGDQVQTPNTYAPTP